jgi:hypothetical protein
VKELFEQTKRVPWLLLAAGGVLLAALVIAAVMVAGGGDGDAPSTPTPVTSAASPTATRTPAATRSPTATATQATEATATPAPNRMDCDAIRGTPYLSADERQWYVENCLESPSGPDGGPVNGSEYAIGARLVIASIGVNAEVVGADVGSDGLMPDPTGYFNVVLYNFPFHAGIGDANRVLSGHVDCARCVNGGPGAAVFWSARTLGSGATVQYVNPDGSVAEYVVFASYSTDPNVDWAAILGDDAADMTLITCTGTFSAGEYSERHVVQLRRVGG